MDSHDITTIMRENISPWWRHHVRKCCQHLVCEWLLCVAPSVWLLRGVDLSVFHSETGWSDDEWVFVNDGLAPNRQQITIRINTDQIFSRYVCLNTRNAFMIIASCMAECRCVIEILRGKMGEILEMIFSNAVVHIMARAQQTTCYYLDQWGPSFLVHACSSQPRWTKANNEDIDQNTISDPLWRLSALTNGPTVLQ